MNGNKIVLSVVFSLLFASVFAAGKTMAEWLHECDMARNELNGKLVPADNQKAVAKGALADAARMGEAAAVARYQAGLDSACASAQEMVDWYNREGYFSDREGFEKLLKVVDEAVKRVKTPPKPTSTLEAYQMMEEIGLAAFVLSAGMEWLRENKAGRDDAREVRRDIEKRLLPYFKSRSIPDVVKTEYDFGVDALKLGGKFFGQGSFDEALKCFSRARESLVSARCRMIVLADAPVPVER